MKEEIKVEELSPVHKHKQASLPWNSITSYIHCYPREQRIKVEQEKARIMRRKYSNEQYVNEEIATVEKKYLFSA